METLPSPGYEVVCWWCDRIIIVTTIDRDIPVFCSEKCKEMEGMFLRWTTMWTWSRE